jgi:hypothetical protein
MLLSWISFVKGPFWAVSLTGSSHHGLGVRLSVKLQISATTPSLGFFGETPASSFRGAKVSELRTVVPAPALLYEEL